MAKKSIAKPKARKKKVKFDTNPETVKDSALLKDIKRDGLSDDEIDALIKITSNSRMMLKQAEDAYEIDRERYERKLSGESDCDCPFCSMVVNNWNDVAEEHEQTIKFHKLILRADKKLRRSINH